MSSFRPSGCCDSIPARSRPGRCGCSASSPPSSSQSTATACSWRRSAATTPRRTRSPPRASLTFPNGSAPSGALSFCALVPFVRAPCQPASRGWRFGLPEGTTPGPQPDLSPHLHTHEQKHGRHPTHLRSIRRAARADVRAPGRAARSAAVERSRDCLPRRRGRSAHRNAGSREIPLSCSGSPLPCRPARSRDGTRT